MFFVKSIIIILFIFFHCAIIRGQLAAAGQNMDPPAAKQLKRGDRLHVSDIKDKEENEANPVRENVKPAEGQLQGNNQQERPPEQHPNEAALPRLPAGAGAKAPGDIGGDRPSGGQPFRQPPAAAAEERPAAGQPFRQPPAAAGGDNLSDRPECAFEIAKHCSNVPRHNDVQVLLCLQDLDEKDESLSQICQHMLWEFKVNLTQDERFRKAAEQFCKDEIDHYTDCAKVTSERGHMISCLSDFKDSMPDGHCKGYLTRVETVIFSDFRLVGPFVHACRDDVRKMKCGQLEDERTKVAADPAQTGQQQQQQQQQRVMHSQGATLDCMIRKMIETGKGDQQLDPKCRHEITRIAELQADSFHLDRPLFFACRADRERFCGAVTTGVLGCLADHRYDLEMSRECREALDIRLQLMARDYKISKQLLRGCKNEMRDYKCDFQLNQPLPPPPEHLYLSYLILCLEEAARTVNVTGRFSMECQTQLFDHRRLLLSDYRMDPEVVLACSEDIGKHCEDKFEDGGRTLHCLMGRVRSRERDMNQACRQAISRMMQAADVGSDYRVDRVLYNDCRRLIDSVCQTQTTSHTDTLSCLMMHVESPLMTDNCENRLLEVQYFLARDFKLDPQLYHACKEDAASKCSDSGPWAEKAVLPAPPMDAQQQQQQPNQDPKQLAPGVERGYLVVTCLYRHVYSEDDEHRPSPTCAKEVQRVMRERSVNVNLMPHIEDACLRDLAEKCSQRTEHGQEIRCLQENIKDLESGCKKVVEEFTEQEGMDARLDQALMRACNPVLEQYCKDAFDKVVDRGDIMECLLRNKGTAAMNNKCRAFVNHYELMSLKDYKFTYKFRQACKHDIETQCVEKGVASDKAAIVSCLSEIVVKHALLGGQEQVTKECRKQLRAEYFSLETVEANIGDPKLVDACRSDIKTYCDKADNVMAAMECLREHKPELVPRCRKYVFKKERLEFQDNSFDMTLNRVCADEIRTLCAHEQPERVLHCLKTKIEREGVQKSFECLELIRKRKHEQASDYRLQPMLARACDTELHTVCKKELAETQNKPEDEAQGIVISCLRRHVTTHQRGVVISAGCQVEVRRIIYDSEVDPSLDPPFYLSCKEEIKSKCNQQLMASDGHESLLECMKYNYKKGVVFNKNCKEELARKINEELADIHLDPELNAACATDVQRYCDDVKPGDGKLLKCLLEASKSSNVRLTQQCHAKLLEREQLWRHIKSDNLPISMPGDVGAVVQALISSPARNTLATVLLVAVLFIFAIGLCCGRVTRRVKREMKNR